MKPISVLGAEIDAKRRLSQASLEEVGQQIGLSGSTVTEIRRLQGRGVRPETLEAISDYLDGLYTVEEVDALRKIPASPEIEASLSRRLWGEP